MGTARRVGIAVDCDCSVAAGPSVSQRLKGKPPERLMESVWTRLDVLNYNPNFLSHRYRLWNVRAGAWETAVISHEGNARDHADTKALIYVGRGAFPWIPLKKRFASR